MMSLRRCCCDGSEVLAPDAKPDCVSSGIKERLPLARPSSDRMILRRSPHFPRVCGWADTTLVDFDLATVVVPGRSDDARFAPTSQASTCFQSLHGRGRT